MLLLSSAGLLAIGAREIVLFGIQFSSGGILGMFIGGTLRSYVNGLGASLILTAAFHRCCACLHQPVPD